MHYKDTSQQTFYLGLFILYAFYCSFIFHLVDLGEFLIRKVNPHTTKCGHPCSRLNVNVH